MSQYDELDRLILAAADTKPKGASRFGCDAMDEAGRIGRATGRYWRDVIDGRLQALRKRGQIEFVRPDGWRMKGQSK